MRQSVTSATPAVNPVLRVPPASPAEAAAHFGASLAFHADVSDVASVLAAGGDPGFVVIDTRSTASWDQGRIPGPRLHWAREGFAFETWEGREQSPADPLTAPVDAADRGC